MSNRVLSSGLSTAGINKLISELKSLENNLDFIAEEIVEKLAERGIKVAEYCVYSDWRSLVEFKYEPISLGEGEFVGEDVRLIHSIWYTNADPKIRKQRDAYVSPLLMSEYGAGPYAVAGHRGTFPGQRHAFKSEWSWFDASGKRHTSEEDYHKISTQPMYRAMYEMMESVEKVAKEVFSSYEFY